MNVVDDSSDDDYVPPSYLDMVAQLENEKNRRSVSRIGADLEGMAEPGNAPKTVVRRVIKKKKKKVPQDASAQKD